MRWGGKGERKSLRWQIRLVRTVEGIVVYSPRVGERKGIKVDRDNEMRKGEETSKTKER